MNHMIRLKNCSLTIAVVLILVGLILMVGCQSGRYFDLPDVPEVTLTLFRGVDANRSGRAKLSPSQFGFNTDLSTFSNPADAPVQKACNYELEVTGIVFPPTPGDSGPVVGLPQGYIATFDNIPPGHWSISAPFNVGPDQAKRVVSAFASANRRSIVDGVLNNCH